MFCYKAKIFNGLLHATEDTCITCRSKGSLSISCNVPHHIHNSQFIIPFSSGFTKKQRLKKQINERPRDYKRMLHFGGKM